MNFKGWTSKWILGSLVPLLSACYAVAGTVPYPDDDIIDSIKFRCARPEECRKITREEFLGGHIMKLRQGMRYTDINSRPQVAPADGFYVGIGHRMDKFFKLPDVGATSDGNYYYCEAGRNIVIDDGSQIGNDDLVSEEELGDQYGQVPSYCTSFWVPQKLLVPPGTSPGLPPGTGYPPGTYYPGYPGTPGYPGKPGTPSNLPPCVQLGTCGGVKPPPPPPKPHWPPPICCGGGDPDDPDTPIHPPIDPPPPIAPVPAINPLDWLPWVNKNPKKGITF